MTFSGSSTTRSRSWRVRFRLSRMETLRRATIYAMKDRALAGRLFEALSARAERSQSDAPARFDAGYLAATYRQSFRAPTPAGDVNGLAWIERAIEQQHGDAQMELAAAIVTVGPEVAGHRQHVERAVAGAKTDALLARNLVQQARNLNMTNETMRAKIGSGS